MNEKNNIVVKPFPQYIKEQSSPEKDRYFFAYTITITNQGTIPAKLISRRWLITDSNGIVQEVEGEGVVGEQPHLKPGESFHYSSAAIIDTPVGIMQGEYSMISDQGDHFTTPIPQFTLSIPRIIH
jgi:ApaG protein